MFRPFRAAVSVALVLGAAVIVAAPASATSDACLYDGSTKIVTVIFPVPANQSRTVSRAGAAITYNGSACSVATVNNTKRIDVFGYTGNQALTIDLSNGAFAPGAGHEPTGLSEIEWHVDLGNGTDALTILGSAGADSIRFGSTSTVKLNGDDDDDVALANTEVRTVIAGNGNDHVIAAASVPRVVLYGQG